MATLLLAAENNEPLDEVVYSEVMFDPETSGEVPEHRDFIYNVLKPFAEQNLGVKFNILRAGKTYDDVFHHVLTRGKYSGQKRGFIWAGMCGVNRDCKMPPITKYCKSLGETVDYVGIAKDEPKRLARLKDNQVSLLDKYGFTEADAAKLCEKYSLLSPVYEHCRRNGCWFCPNARNSELKHLAEHHPELFKKLIKWEREDNVFNRNLTRTETPSEVMTRLLATNGGEILRR